MKENIGGVTALHYLPVSFLQNMPDPIDGYISKIEYDGGGLSELPLLITTKFKSEFSQSLEDGICEITVSCILAKKDKQTETLLNNLCRSENYFFVTDNNGFTWLLGNPENLPICSFEHETGSSPEDFNRYKLKISYKTAEQVIEVGAVQGNSIFLKIDFSYYDNGEVIDPTTQTKFYQPVAAMRPQKTNEGIIFN